MSGHYASLATAAAAGPGGSVSEYEAPLSTADRSSVSIRIYVPELNIQKVLHFRPEELVWNVKQQCLATLPKVSSRFNGVLGFYSGFRRCPITSQANETVRRSFLSSNSIWWRGSFLPDERPRKEVVHRCVFGRDICQSSVFVLAGSWCRILP